MAEIWLPNAERIPGESAGAMNGDGSYKILLHSTEGASIEGAVSAYRQHRSWPTLTVDCPRRRVVEHLPLNVAARALRNDPGGADETNRDGTIHVQIELVGFAERPASIGGPDDLEWLGREVIGPIARLTGVPLRSTVDWVAYPASYGKRAAQRLSPTAWDAYSGVLGHQHAPDNDHGDPGRIDIARILAAARGQTPEEDDMGAVEQRQIADLTELCRRIMILVRDVLVPLAKETRTQVRNDVQQANVVTGVDTALSPDRKPGSGARQGVKQLADLGVDDEGLAAQLAELNALVEKVAGNVDAPTAATEADDS
ncbi:MAG TPA: hypothetical protein VKZ89_01895 [Thermobifida alba]|nr:hypothetical protein [Thermobifida alba]